MADAYDTAVARLGTFLFTGMFLVYILVMAVGATEFLMWWLAASGAAMSLLGLVGGSRALRMAGLGYLLMAVAIASAWWLVQKNAIQDDSLPVFLTLVIGHVLIPIAMGVERVARSDGTCLAWRCRACGQGLYGLSEPVCPECGTPMTEQQIANAPLGMFRDRAAKNQRS